MLIFLNEYINRHGYSPTVRDAAVACRLAYSNVSRYFRNYIDSGWVTSGFTEDGTIVAHTMRLTPLGKKVLEKENRNVRVLQPQ